MRLLLDSSVIIDALRLKANTINYLKKIESKDAKLFVSAVTAFEIYSGSSSANTDEKKLIKKLMGYFEVVDLSWSIGKLAGELYRKTTSKVETADYLIAASAIEVGAQIVTLNKKHFQKMPKIKLYE